MFGVGNQISVSVNNNIIIGKLIGIDHYQLQNFEGKKIKWTSYTLTSSHRNIYARFWFVRWDKEGWILWTKARKKIESNKLILKFSGIATISFTGNQGKSTPTASLATWKTGIEKLYAIERFTGSDVMYFDGVKIKRPEIYKDTP